MKNTSTQNKIVGLEIIRFVASIAVIIWHYHHFVVNSDQPLEVIDTGQPFYAFLFPFYISGAYGVITFWCLSGYIFFWKYSDQITNKLITAKRFFILRFSRLYPLHLATILFIIPAQLIYLSKYGTFFIYQENDARHLILQLFMASNWGFEDGLSFNGPIWSVSIEILVYTVFFIAMRYLGKSFIYKAAICVISLLIFKFLIRHEFFDCMAFFFLGGLVDACQNRFKINKKLMSICSLLLVSIGVLTYSYIDKPVLSFLVILPGVIYLFAEYFVVPSFMYKFVEALGNLTYGIYLLHFPIQIAIVLAYTYLGQAIPFYSNYFFVFFILLTCLLSRIIFLKFEMPSQNYLRKKLLKTKKTILLTPLMIPLVDEKSTV